MRLADDSTLALSPSDLANHLACPHLTQLELRVARGELVQPHLDRRTATSSSARGTSTRPAYLARLEAERALDRADPHLRRRDFDDGEARRATEDAIRAGGGGRHLPGLPHRTARWRGFADFLERLPDGTYEPVDTKLARSAKPPHVLQLCFYAEQLARIQGAPVEHVHVELGRGERETFRSPSSRRSSGGSASGCSPRSPTSRRPTAGRATTAGSATSAHLCREQLVADDHLTLVAGLRRSHAER